MALPLHLLQRRLSGGDSEHVMLVETCEMLLKVNFLADDNIKSLISRVFIEADTIVFCAYANST